eukprot:TRINITY_DN7471_c0_g1_i1.p1 TRINITY_DN7471_c0_g1~~TRINITY_DN7471_c0_g1_i1.p1  ORF type:complete len:529 (+),score=139.51 TRINITY_DN7471_c0_g1_i1:59-1645(+)
MTEIHRIKRAGTVQIGIRSDKSGGRENSSRTQLEHNANTDYAADISGAKRIHCVVCTVGPATSTVEKLEQLMEAGMNIARLNFSHGSYEAHGEMIKKVRQAAANTKKLVAIALDTKGPEIRTGKLKEGIKEIKFTTGMEVTVSVDPAHYHQCDETLLYMDYANLPKVVKVGGQIYVDDGLLQLRVLEINDKSVRVQALNSATVTDHKGVNLPNSPVDLPAVSEKDAKDLKFAREQGLDMVFASFIRKPTDVITVRQALGDGPKIKIISKIENVEGCENFLDILKVTDGVMVARGDLGIEIPAEKVFAAQKMMIANCNIAGKPVICVTQMLESMTGNPRPTRAEVSDVANAILDGADCVMLSGETAKGKYPVEAASMMARIVVQAQLSQNERAMFDQIRLCQPHPVEQRDVIAQSSVNTAFEVGAMGIIVLSNTGTSAALIAKYRPGCPIFAVTSNEQNARQLLLHRGVFPVLTPEPADRRDYNARVHGGIKYGIESGQLEVGDIVVAVHSDGSYTDKGANMVRIMTVS